MSAGDGQRVRVEHYHLHTKDGGVRRDDCTDPQCPMSWSQCRCGPGERCFDCATDDEMAAAIGPWPERAVWHEPR